MSRYDIVVVGPHGVKINVFKGIYERDRAVERAEKWFEENVRGRYDGKVVVLEKVQYTVKTFIEENPDEHEAKERDISFEDFFGEVE